MSEPNIPLLSHADLAAPIAWRAGQPLSAARFIAAAQALAKRLPEAEQVLNLCGDRYLFALGFAAALLRGQHSLLPSSQSADSVARLAARYPTLYCLYDQPACPLALPSLRVLDAAPDAAHSVPQIPAAQTAVVLFTSGSTGEPQAHSKSWGELVRSVRLPAAQAIFPAAAAIVATVPVQHSYGLESSLLSALHNAAAFDCGKPFFAADIAAALAALPRPRVLVTTPLHLRTLLEAELAMPPLDLILSATAPLTGALAAAAEQRLAAPLVEIYGSTESGQIARRASSREGVWQLFPGLRLQAQASGWFVSGGHLPAARPLSDVLELVGSDAFILHGRSADMVNVAGKRTSIAYLNHQLLSIPGVRDAAFYLPECAEDAGTARLVAFVVAPSLGAAEILAALRLRIDAAFMPRPLHAVAQLPRNELGKLPRAVMATLHQACLADGR